MARRPAGVVAGVADNVLLCDPNDVAGITRIFNDHKDIAAVILEPTGASFGKMPIVPSFLALLRDLTRQAGSVLIFDEVVTGFRVSPGGAQAALGITPDMTTLAKILSGGLPGGAVVGRKDILDWLDFEVTKETGQEKIAHQGTFNANPISAAAGIATLEIVAATDACARANAYGEAMRAKMNEVLEEERVKWAVHGSYSGMHIYTNSEGADIVPSQFDAVAFIQKMLEQAERRGCRRAGADGAAGQWRRYEHRSVRVDFGDAWGGGDGDHRRCVPRDGAGVEAGGGHSLSVVARLGQARVQSGEDRGCGEVGR